KVSSVTPALGGLEDGTLLTIQTSGIANMTNVSCIFGNHWAFGSYDEATSRLFCKAPPSIVERTVNLSLVINSMEMITGFAFTYVVNPEIVRFNYSIDSSLIAQMTLRLSPTTLKSVWIKALGTVCQAFLKSNFTFVCSMLFLGYVNATNKVSISVNGFDFIKTSYEVHVGDGISNLNVTYIDPPYAKLSNLDEKQIIHVFGNNLDVCNSAYTGITCFCVFGSNLTPAFYISTNEVHCNIPLLKKSTSFSFNVLDVLYIPQDFASQTFELLDEIILSSAKPNVSLSIGGASIAVRGSGFYSQLGCWYNHKLFLPAIIYNSSLLYCKVPPRNSLPSTVKVVIAAQIKPDLTQAPSFSLGYIDNPIVQSISPLQVALTSNATITMNITTRTDLWAGQNVQCQFNTDLSTNGVLSILDNELLQINCVLPQLTTPGSVTVNILLNNQQLIVTQWTIETMLANSIAEVQPSLLPLHNAIYTTVTLDFELPSSIAQIDCVYQKLNANRTLLSPGLITAPRSVVCLAPTIDEVTTLTLALYIGNEIYSTNNVYLKTYEPPLGTKLMPTISSTTGGQRLQIYGNRFFSTQTLSCQFGSYRSTPAQFISSTEIDCFIPPAPLSGTIPIGIVVAGTHVDWLKLTLKYVRPSQITAVHPVNGPIGGSTALQVYADGFDSHLNLQCSFTLNNLTLFTDAAISISNRTLICQTPTVPAPGLATLSIVDAVDKALLTTQALEFAFVFPIAVLSTNPANAIQNQPTIVDIIGMHFLPSAICRFANSINTPAFYISKSSIRCSLFENITALQSPLRTEISNNGVDYVFAASLPLYPPLVAESISPLNGPASGGTPLILQGANLGLATHCRFHLTQVPALVLSTTKISCISPPHPRGTITVEVSANQRDFTIANIIFEYLDIPTVMSVLPARTQAGSLIAIRGAGFLQRGENVLCRFGTSDAVLAQVVTSNLIKCTAPNIQLQVVQGALQVKVPVEISLNNGIDFTSNEVLFEYLPQYHIRNIKPQFGFDEGGTAVHLIGRGFTQASQLRCSFGSYIVESMFVSTTQIICITPPHPGGIVQLILVNEMDNFFPHSTALLYEFVKTPLLYSSAPGFGGSSGGTEIAVFGRHFKFSTTMVCRFDQLIVPAIFVNSSCVFCVTPPHSSASIPLSFSPNGVDFTSEMIMFTYEALPTISTMVDRFGISPFGNDIIVIRGTGFAKNGTQCNFQNQWKIDALFISDTLVKCVTPPQSLNGASTLLFIQTPTGISNTINIPYFSKSLIRYIIPSFGSSVGGTNLRLLGSRFNQSYNLTCFFTGDNGWSIITPAKFLSRSEINCPSPFVSNVSLPTPLNVGVLNDASKVCEVTAVYTAIPSLQITSVSTYEAYHFGGYTIIVSGFGFYISSSISCVFGSHLVPAAYLNSTTISCQTPRYTPGTIPFSVSNNGFDLVSPGINFTFLPSAYVTSVKPATGSALGNTTITIAGSNLSPTLPLECRFGSIIIAATLVDKNTAMCLSPAIKSSWYGQSIELAIGFRSQPALFTLPYQYQALGRILSVVPSVAWSSGGTIVKIITQNMNVASNATCIFGDIIVPVLSINATTILCKTPKRQPSRVSFAISNVEISTEPFYFTFLPDPIVTWMSTREVYLPGGQEFILLGNYLSSITMCTIGDKSMPAYASKSEIRCITPSQTNIGSYNLKLTSAYSTITTSWSLLYKVAPPDIVMPVYVEDMSRLNRPEIYLVEPNLVGSSGGTVLKVVGSNFQNVPTLQCQFGEVMVPAQFISTTSLSCTAPKHTPASIILEVSNDGELYSISATSITISNDAVMTSMSPVYGTVGTTISVLGDHFVSSLKLVCRFGAITVPAAYISTTNIQCRVPDPTQTNMNINRDVVMVYVSNNNATFTSHGSFFTFAMQPIVTSTSPQFVSQTNLMVRGYHFTPYPVSCVWNSNIILAATVFTSTLLKCPVPRGMTGSAATLQLGLNIGMNLSPPWQVALAPPIILYRISPIWGPALSGTSLIHVFGDSFQPTVELSCLVGTTTIPAYFVNATAIQCLLTTHPAGVVPIAITANGVDYSSPLNFTFVPNVKVIRIRPTMALVTGQLPVFVQGQNFFNSSLLQCRFGDIRVKAMYISQEMLVCIAPSRVGNIVNATTTVMFDVSTNSVDFTNSSVKFTYLPACLKGSYCPGHDIFPSPNGTYIASDTQNFTLCRPGTFQPRTAQTQCLPCPVGFFCPDFGLSQPVLCPAGYICDRHGVKTPTIECNQGHYCSKGTKTSNVYDFENLPGYIVNNQTGLLYYNDSSRTWPSIPRVAPATGTRQRDHSPIAEDPFCLFRVCAPNSSASLAEKPFACPLGTYCQKGATTCLTITGNYSTPQVCFSGFFCPAGSRTPEGEGPCPTGYYCPNPTDALACPVGMYCPGVGNTKPTACYPGTYQPSIGQSYCVLCPLGSICPGWNNTAPQFCPAGFVCSSLGLSHPVQLCPAGFYCNEGTWTLDPSELSPLRPYPCEPGTFCLGGVKAALTIDWLPNVIAGATASQTCTEGSFCLEGTMEATLCYPGHYCPPGATFPVITPPGTFSSDNGAVAPMLCFPGTFAVFASSTNCQVCPAGYTCPGYGNYIPTICPQGFYRSIADSITCRLCPPGTWSPNTGLTDISYCEPCPVGRVCGIQGMNNLNQSIICPSGYVCGEGTTLEMQYLHECPAGYYCASETTQDKQFSNLCPAGSVCYRGTKDTENTRYSCPVASFCPLGTSDSSVKESQCPILTTSLPGSNCLNDCSIKEISVCDKDPTLSYYPQFTYAFQGKSIQYNSWTTNSPTGEVQVVKKILPVNESASVEPWVNGTVDVIRACPDSLNNNGGELITVIGRNFLDTNQLTCEFRVADSIVFTSVPATFVNETRVQCRAPPVALGGLDSLIVNVHVTNYGIHISSTSAELEYSSNPTKQIKCGYNNDEEGPWPPELGWFALRGLSEILFSFDLRHIPVDMVYDEHWKIAIYVNPSICNDMQCNEKRVVLPPIETSPCRQPLDLPISFTSTIFQQHDMINITILALEDMVIKPEIHIVYGIFASAEELFINSTSVEIRSPSRANDTQGVIADSRPLSSVISFEQQLVPREYSFLAVYPQELGLITPFPLNLPPRFSQLERGRVLVTNVVTEDNPQPDLLDEPVSGANSDAYWQLPFSTLDITTQMVAKYRETFQGLSEDNSTYLLEEVLLPYLPYFSHCRGYGRYMTIFDLLESDQCALPELTEEPANWDRREFPALPNQDDVVVVGPTSFFQEPVADYCMREIACDYEEDLATIEVNPRWFEAGTLTHLFEIVNEPVSYEDFLTGSNLYEKLLSAGNSDIFVPVIVDRSAANSIVGGCTLQCFPRKMTLDIAYYQVSKQLKRIVVIKLIYDEFDTDKTRTDYSLHIEYHPLGYMELIINFAFEPTTFIILFNVIGLVAWMGCGIAWIITRLTTRIRDPPKLYYFSYISLLAPPPTIGYILCTIPFTAVVGTFYLLLNGDIAFSIKSNYPGGQPYWLLDNIKNHYMATQIDPALVTSMRHGRTGLCFLLMGCYFMYQGAFIFIPKTISISERAAEEKEENGDEAEESLWQPTLWQRMSFIFASILQGLFMVVMVEFSFWDKFPDYLWYILFILNLLVPIIDMACTSIVHDKLLLAPLKCTTNVIIATITMAAPDFEGFVIAFYILFGIAFLHRLYFEVVVDVVFDHICSTIAYTKKGIKAVVQITKLFLAKKPKRKPKISKEEEDAAKAEEEKKKKEEAEKEESKKPKEEEGETVEPIIDFTMEYGMETLAFFLQPTMVTLLIIFRSETVIAENYEIKVQDLEYYCYFFAFIVPYQLLSDVFILHCLELFKGWKLYDYFVYCRYRYIQREKRWKGFEHNLDECIEEELRHLDQMCFSSQFHFMCGIQTLGIISFVLAIEIMIRNKYNMFGDPAALIISPFMFLTCVCVHRTCIYLSRRLALYKLRHETTTWHNNPEDEEIDAPNWEELERIKGASHEAFLMNQRLTSETFRFKFLNYNRAWIIQQLPNILTPRTLRRARPYLITQFSKIISSLNPQVSDDEDDDSGKPRFGPVSLNAPSRDIIRLWLAKARRRLRLRLAVQPLINAARKVECENCLSRRQLQVELVIPLEVMGDKFDKAYPSDQFNVTEWKEFFAKHEKFKTLCLNCLAKQKKESFAPLGMGTNAQAMEDAENAAQFGFGIVELNAASRALLMKWYRLGQDRVFGKTGKRRAVANVSDDEEDIALRGAKWANQPVKLNAASTAIALKWMVSARLSIKAKNSGKKIMPLESAPKPKRKRPPVKEGAKARRK
ncbi:hypothetical protein THRCLA_05945, partial [Thraustotheca clavata]